MQAARGTPVGQPPEPGQPQTPLPPRRVAFLVGTALIVLALDIISKVCVVAFLEGHAPVHVIGSFLQLVVTRNPGAAFSIGVGMTVVFSVIAIGVIAVILRTSRRIRSIAWAITLGLLLGGATGNLVDRIFRWPGLFRGWVVDWIELPHWPVFNLADSAIVCGGVLAVLLSARGLRLDGSRATPGDDSGPASDTAPAPGTGPSSVIQNETRLTDSAGQPQGDGAGDEQASAGQAPGRPGPRPGETAGGGG
jgi:signal peptidase II